MRWEAAVVCSCPGKVLLSGGYLVLDRAYSGLVVATTARFYAILKEPSLLEPLPAFARCFSVQVVSPQFHQAEWNYELAFDHESWHLSKFGRENPFIDQAVVATTNLLSALYGPQSIIDRALKGCRIFMLGDNPFYSQDTVRDAKDDIIHRLNIPIAKVHKTGLGSSAAMVTSLIAALAQFLSPPGTSVSSALIHNLAQYVHSVAQGKIGSGFDVSAAVHGSHVYTRFDPACLQPLMEVSGMSDDPSVPPALLASTLTDANPLWKDLGAQAQPFVLPPCTTLLLADVDAGAHTPSMVSSVLKWRAAQKSEADALWQDLGRLNAELAATFRQLKQLHEDGPEAYESRVAQLADAPAGTWTGGPIETALQRVAVLIQAIRKGMKKMGEAARVDIEPDLQTEILDACSALPGVLGGGVPGAGGLDAAWVLVLSPVSEFDAVTKRVEALWRQHSGIKVSKLLEQNWDAEAQGGLVVATVAQVPLLQRTLEQWAL